MKKIASYSTAPSVPAGAMVYAAPVISIRVIREAGAPVPSKVTSPAAIAAILFERYAQADREILVAVLLDTKNKPIAIDPVFVGSLNAAIITNREIFKSAIVLGAAAIILAHNHPSCDTSPSPEDLAVTASAIAAGKLLDIELLDHLILSSDGTYTSLRERAPQLWERT